MFTHVLSKGKTEEKHYGGTVASGASVSPCDLLPCHLLPVSTYRSAAGGDVQHAAVGGGGCQGHLHSDTSAEEGIPDKKCSLFPTPKNALYSSLGESSSHHFSCQLACCQSSQ